MVSGLSTPPAAAFADIPTDAIWHQGPQPAGAAHLPWWPDIVRREREGGAGPLLMRLGDLAADEPDRIAVDDGALRLSRRQLHGMALALCGAIRQAPLAEGAMGVLVADDALYLVALLGCIAAGRPAMLLSTETPADFTDRQARAAGLAGLIVNAAALRTAPEDGWIRLPVEAALAGGAPEPAPPGLAMDAPAVILATSGSSGAPKAVVRSQRALMERSMLRASTCSIEPDSRALVLGPPATGAAVTHRLSTLLAGATLHLLDVTQAGIASLGRRIETAGITHLRAPPALLKVLARQDGVRASLGSLRVVRTGGDVLLHADLRPLRAALPQACRIVYGFNMTEGPVTEWAVPEDDTHDPVRVAAGPLLPGTEALLLDEDGRPAAPGEPGEIVIRSAGTAAADWIAGRAVEDRFPSDPARPGTRLYRTGDVVRICPDGVLVLLGRRDRMVKIRGLRVEPAVVEVAMRDLPGVADAAVVVARTGDTPRLIGFVEPGVGADTGLLDRLAAHLQVALPAHLRPAALHRVAAIPIALSGKRDDAALMALAEARAPAVAAKVGARVGAQVRAAPSPAILAKVGAAWRAVLPDDLDPDLPFYAAGGDSLRFLELVFLLEQATGQTLPLSLFRLDMTRAMLAKAVAGALAGAAGSLSRDRAPAVRLVLFPGLGGDEPRLMRLRAACPPGIAPTQHAYGAWPDWVPSAFRFADVVARLAEAVAGEADDRPPVLAGYSLGGTVAWRVAEHLQAQGRPVAGLVILDALAPNLAERSEHAVAPPSRASEWAAWRAARRQGTGDLALAHIATRRLLSPRGAPLLRWLARHQRRVLPRRMDFALSFHLTRSLLAGHTAAWRADLGPARKLAVAATVIRAAHHATAPAYLGWDAFCDEVGEVVVPGDHFTMLDPPHETALHAAFVDACLGHGAAR
jgi:acyl-coenzyme A synthetase/AMP-(fatty) acid ligase/thioesterase domain-containing protein/acyl carrier protein